LAPLLKVLASKIKGYVRATILKKNDENQPKSAKIGQKWLKWPFLTNFRKFYKEKTLPYMFLNESYALRR